MKKKKRRSKAKSRVQGNDTLLYNKDDIEYYDEIKTWMRDFNMTRDEAKLLKFLTELPPKKSNLSGGEI